MQRHSNLDGRTTRHLGDALSQRARERIEDEARVSSLRGDRLTTIAGQEPTRLRGRDRVGWSFTLAVAAYNLIRLPKLLGVPGRPSNSPTLAETTTPRPPTSAAEAGHRRPPIIMQL